MRLSVTAVLALALAVIGTCPASGQQPAGEAPAQVGTIDSYVGLPIEEIEIPAVSATEASQLIALTPLKPGEPLTRELLHNAIESLFATGRFSDVQAEAERSTSGVRLRFLTMPNYFVGLVTVEGVTSNPSDSQLVAATRLQLGELFTREAMTRALAGMRRLLEENGYHTAQITNSEQRDAKQAEVNIDFRVNPGARAVVGRITLEGNAGYSKGQIEDIGKFHSGDPVIAARLTRALQRIRSKYQKEDRLLAAVSVAGRNYRPQANAVDYTFHVDRGPIVEIAEEGFKISQRDLRKLVPIYEEGAVDDDLLNEGRRNIQNRLQTLGFFDATVGVRQQTLEGGKQLRVLYVISPGPRHKLVLLEITGNKYFSDEQLRAIMQEQPAGRIFTHGRYSEALLAQDVSAVQAFYRVAGYRQANVTSKVLDSYEGDPHQLGVRINIDEGPQTRVAWVRLEGNYTLPTDQLPVLSTEEGQPFSEDDLSNDRDRILSKYFDNGFSNASVDVSYVPVTPSPGDLPLVGVVFKIREGEQFFVNNIFLSGLHFTRPGVVRRELRVQPGSALSQQDMLETQRHLYDLGLFNEVDTAVQNPDGTDPHKNVLVAMREARRYTFDYGFGFEFQTGQPSVGTNQPLGQTGISPRVSFGLTRINFGGRNQTVTMKTNLSRLQQRGLINFDAQKLMNRDLHFSATALYDNTVDVSTFTSERVQGTIQAEQVLRREALTQRVVTSLTYGFSFRRVQASNIQVTENLIPLLSRPTRVGEPNFFYLRNRRDNDLETTKGNYTTVEGGVAASYFGSEADFSRLLIKNATYHSFRRNPRTGQGFVFARATSIGLENPFGNTVLLDPSEPVPVGHTLIPLPERFFSGGGTSHRGFGLNQAGPRDPFTGFPVGGSALFLNNLELRFPNITLPYLHDTVGFTAFHDMGNVFARPQEMVRSLVRWHQSNPQLCFQESTHTQCDYNYISHAIGLGVRYQTPIGPLRFDFGYNLNPPAFPSYTNITTNTINGQTTGQFGAQRAGHFNFSFSVGQSF